MVKIRLSRLGRKGGTFYRVVAVDERKIGKGKFIENLGWWNPSKNGKKILKERVSYWIQNGARLTPTVKKLFL